MIRNNEQQERDDGQHGTATSGSRSRINKKVVTAATLCFLAVGGQFSTSHILNQLRGFFDAASLAYERNKSSSSSMTTTTISSSDRRSRRRRQRIDAKLVHPLTLHGLKGDGSDVHYRCQEGVKLHHFMYHKWGGPMGNRKPILYPYNTTDYGFVDTHVQIQSMDLKILIVGNSLAEQLHFGLDEALCFYYKDKNNDEDDNDSSSSNRTSDRTMVKSNVSAAIEALHVLDRESFRRTSVCNLTFYGKNDVFDNTYVVQTPPNPSNGGRGLLASVFFKLGMIDTKTVWNRDNPAIQELIHRLGGNLRNSTAFIAVNGTTAAIATGEHNSNNTSDDSMTTSTTPVADVFLYHWQSGAVPLSTFDEYYLDQTIVAASTLFQSSVLIVTTIALHNNAKTNRDIESIFDINKRIRRYARQYNENTTKTLTTVPSSNFTNTVRAVMVLDYAQLLEQYDEVNAQHLGMSPNETYTKRLKTRKWDQVVSHVCADLPYENDPKGCMPGMVSVDGIHLCPETVHGRVNAAMICLLDCAYHKYPPPTSNRGNDEDDVHDGHAIQRCSDDCSQTYMSLRRLPFHPSPSSEKREIILTPHLRR